LNTFKKLWLVAGFALLAACGGNAEKFVGEWIQIDTPVKPHTIIITAKGSNQVELDQELVGTRTKKMYVVDGDNLLSSSKVLYTLEGEHLVTPGGRKFVRK